MTIRNDARVSGIARTPAGLRVQLTDRAVDADAVLVATGPAQAQEAGRQVLYAAKDVAKIASMPRPKIMGDA